MTFSYNPASQITSLTRSNELYAWTGHSNVNLGSTPNGLNQIGNVGAATVTHDSKGNITAIGGDSYGYSSEDFLTSRPGSATLGYDPMGRLYQVAQGGSTTRIGYDGLDRIAEYDGSSAIQRRYIHGPGIDEPITWYEGSGTNTRRFLSSDERGSMTSVTDGSGTVLALNKYDEFGVPQSTNLGRFGYTGQARIPQLNFWYFKARMLSDELGRFAQTDRIGYGDSPNLYAYVLNNPINLTDPSGDQLEGYVGGCITCNASSTVYLNTNEEIGILVVGVKPNEGLNDFQKALMATQATYMLARPYNNINTATISRILEQQALNQARRQCNAFQKLAEDVSDVASNASDLSADMSASALIGSGASLATGNVPLAGLLGQVSLHFGVQAGVFGTVSEFADLAAGNYTKTVGQRLEGALLQPFTRRLGKAFGDKIESAVVAQSQFSRCAR